MELKIKYQLIIQLLKKMRMKRKNLKAMKFKKKKMQIKINNFLMPLIILHQKMKFPKIIYKIKKYQINKVNNQNHHK